MDEKKYTPGTVSISSQEYRDLIESKCTTEAERDKAISDKYTLYSEKREMENKKIELEEMVERLKAKIIKLGGEVD